MMEPERWLTTDPALLADIVCWDILTWRRAVLEWDRVVACEHHSTVLEIGAREGGLALYFAKRGAGRVICSDLHGPSRMARVCHRKHGVANRILYLAADATFLPLPNASVDIVASKSVLGGIGSHGHGDRIDRALAEIYRILKPGGRFCFAENLMGSPWHRWCRRIFTDWGRHWHYFTLEDLEERLSAFARVRIDTCGYLAVLGRREWQRSLLSRADCAIMPLIAPKSRYVGYGVAYRPR